jgi:glycerate-2-kinase
MAKKIKNCKKLAKTKVRKLALEIAEAGLQAIDTFKVVKNTVSLQGKILKIQNEIYPLKDFKRLFVVGVGKCSLEAGAALEKNLGRLITGGIIADVRKGKLKTLQTFAAGHPLPVPQNIGVTKKIIQLLSGLSKDDLVIFIISGGGSTILCQPHNATCEDEKKLYECLTKKGASIREINTVRKHTSFARGGFLAKHAYPAKSVALIFSDISGGNLEFIASGPTIKDTTTVDDAKRILAKFDRENTCGFMQKFIETPKDDKYFKNVKNHLVVSNRTALEAMAEKAKKLKLTPKIATLTLSGEARDAAKKIIKDLKSSAPKTALLYGGELTVTLKGKNPCGGRLQEFGLSAVRFIDKKILLAAVASDGRDNNKFGGVICDAITKRKAKKINLNIENYLKENRSSDFWSKTGDYLRLGDTGSNVSDLIIAIQE